MEEVPAVCENSAADGSAASLLDPAATVLTPFVAEVAALATPATPGGVQRQYP